MTTAPPQEPGGTNAYLSAMIAEARATRDRVIRDFGTLDGPQLNWKPAPDRWSVAQCLKHLITSNEAYWTQFDAVAAGRKTSTLYERLPLLPRLWGALVKRAVAPDSGIRSRTSTVLQPGSSELPASIVHDFAANVESHLERIEAIAGVDHRRTMVTSPIARFITYNLEDAVIITVTHLERHRRQAQAVTEHPAFPRSEGDSGQHTG